MKGRKLSFEEEKERKSIIGGQVGFNGKSKKKVNHYSMMRSGGVERMRGSG